MAIEKVFAIEAAQADIWDALWSELSQGAEASFTVERSNWPHNLVLLLDISNMPCRLSYSIEPKDGHCEVSAKLDPLGRFYGLFQIVTFGHLRRNYEMLLVLGLSNLKKALEPGNDEVDEFEVVEET
jgi:hypothetical protein